MGLRSCCHPFLPPFLSTPLHLRISDQGGHAGRAWLQLCPPLASVILTAREPCSPTLPTLPLPQMPRRVTSN